MKLELQADLVDNTNNPWQSQEAEDDKQVENKRTEYLEIILPVHQVDEES